MEAKEATGIRSRTQRADYQATADPALNEAADRTADIKLLDCGELYDLWERQQWQTQELDFSRDRDLGRNALVPTCGLLRQRRPLLRRTRGATNPKKGRHWSPASINHPGGNTLRFPPDGHRAGAATVE